MAKLYEVRIIPEENGYFAARFPDFPGIVTGGDSPDEALHNAQEALTVTLEMREKKFLMVLPGGERAKEK